MRDYDRERERPSVTRNYVVQDGTEVTSRGPAKPYNELLIALKDVAKEMKNRDYDALRRLAWALGMKGESHACEVIVEELNEPRSKTYMYGDY